VRTNNLIILCVAIFMGVIAALLARNWLLSHTQSAGTEGSGTIVVAAKSLGFGVAISADNVTEIPWASAQLPEGAFATKQELLKDGRRVVLSQLDPNEPVLRSKVTAPGQRGSLSSLIDQDKRAVTVRVDDVRGVAGFILPGDHVDVVLIRTDNAGPRNQSYSDILLEHVKVLAVDQLVNERQETPTIAKAVTLEVTAEQAQKVLLATNVGHLSLILSRPETAASTDTSRRISERDLGRSEPEVAPVPAVAEAAAPPPVRSSTATVTIIRGDKHDEYPVQRYTR
jgi:pilus assembly protein CpaB